MIRHVFVCHSSKPTFIHPPASFEVERDETGWSVMGSLNAKVYAFEICYKVNMWIITSTEAIGEE